MAAKKRSVGLTIIAVGKLLKAVTLIVIGVLALRMVGKSPSETVLHWSHTLRFDAHGRWVHRALGAVTGVDAKKLEEIGFGTFFYAALFSVEGIGLWLQKRWAEYFTIGITVSFVPIEIYEIVHRVSVGKVIALLLNVVVVVYLVLRLRKERREEKVSGR